MADKDFYEILGVAKNAGEDEIKKSYRKLAMQYHPDRNKDNKVAEKKFKEVSAAYEILKDPQKRAAYDQYGHDAFRQGGLEALMVSVILVAVFLIYLKSFLVAALEDLLQEEGVLLAETI
tara:strand:- start:1097 stop:1456 length:360 start_codon:yes stop_codon:yes gene_type:complete